MSMLNYIKKLDYSSPNPTKIENLCQDCQMLDVFKDYINNNLTKEPRALTMTLRNSRLSPLMEDHEIHKYVNDKIMNSRIWKNLTYIIRPEYDNNGRLHYHGIIYAESIEHMSNAVKWWRRIFGFVNKNWNEEIRYLSCRKFKRDNTDKCYWYIRESNNKRQKYDPSYCWAHYLFKDYNRTGLWTIYKLT